VRKDGLDKMQSFTEDLKHSWQSLKDYRNWVVLAVIIDLVGLFAFAKVYVYVWTNAIDSLQAIDGIMEPGLGQDPAVLVSQAAELGVHSDAVLHYAWILLAGIVLIWGISQGINWFLCSKMAMAKKMDWKHFKEHMIKFFALTLVWTFVFVVISYLSARMGMSPLLGLGNGAFMIAAFAVLGYFEFVSYGIVPRYKLREIIQKTFKIGFVHLKKSLLLFAFSILLIIVLGFALAKIWSVKETWAIAFFAVIILPAISYIRILYVRTLEKLKA
jgi:ABC-type uncharacterized transport system fused permease/ATPase subunit